MKKYFTFLGFLLSGLLIISCASKQPAAEVESEAVEEPENEIIIAHFDDWEYKGFGHDLPAWVEAAFSNDTEQLNSIFSENSYVVVKDSGLNSDMCQAAADLETLHLEGREVLAEIWVRVNPEYEVLEEPYFTIRVYKE